MDIDAIREYCLKKPGNVSEDMPFGEEALVFRINQKIFLLMMLTARPLTINLKCDPVRAIELRERFESVQPGYHMNKKHWNTVVLDGKVPAKEVFAMIDHSFEEVLKNHKKVRPSKPARKRRK